ncbi:Hypothetical predicted protein [Olea europaea subsp. europaea]|uniref:Nucleic acid binding NABP domain-containing protein n=1 Tax=Olea europaea subsp. europaea TaxID=158383 RepID=A0A8S0UU37_OLEEU|nr:Hypothetical predicted protein [Olea europaea subsp. europaea]
MGIQMVGSALQAPFIDPMYLQHLRTAYNPAFGIGSNPEGPPLIPSSPVGPGSPMRHKDFNMRLPGGVRNVAGELQRERGARLQTCLLVCPKVFQVVFEGMIEGMWLNKWKEQSNCEENKEKEDYSGYSFCDSN